MDKLKVVTDYSKLSPELLSLFNETYPQGIAGHTVRFPNSKGEIVTAVRLETEDRIYLVKLSTRAKEVLLDEDLDEMIRPLSKGVGEEEPEVESDDDDDEKSSSRADDPDTDEDDD